MKFHESDTAVCETKNAKSVTVLANDKCNRAGVGAAHYYYKLKCGGEGITGSFYCDDTCKNCQIDNLDAAIDGKCVTKAYGKSLKSTDVTSTDITFSGICKVASDSTDCAFY